MQNEKWVMLKAKSKTQNDKRQSAKQNGKWRNSLFSFAPGTAYDCSEYACNLVRFFEHIGQMGRWQYI
jgi:hypothetical protein